MGNEVIGETGSGTISELITTSITKHDIFSAVTDQAIGGLYAALGSEDTGIVTVIDDALVQYEFGACVQRGAFRYDTLVGISDHGELQVIVDAGIPEINTGPASGVLTVRLIQPVSLKVHFCAIVFISGYL